MLKTIDVSDTMIPSRRLVLALLLLPSMVANAGDFDLSGALKFANLIRDAIRVGDPKEIVQIPCYPNALDCFGTDELAYLVGEDAHPSRLRTFLSEPCLDLNISGPYSVGEAHQESVYSVIFYRCGLDLFEADGTMTVANAQRYWLDGYAGTEVIELEGDWAIYRTAFLYGTELPWVELPDAPPGGPNP